MFLSKSYIKIISVLAVIAASIYVLLFVPGEQKYPTKSEIGLKTFLTANTKWADSLIQTLSVDEKINQLLLAEINCELFKNNQQFSKDLQPSGIVFTGYDVAQFLSLQKQFKQNAQIPLLCGHIDYYFPLTGEKFMLDDTIMLAINNQYIKKMADSIWLSSAYSCGLNFFISPYKFNPDMMNDTVQKKYIPYKILLSENQKANIQLTNNKLLLCSGIFSYNFRAGKNVALSYLFDSVRTGMVEVDESYYSSINTANLYDTLNTYYYFKGLLYTRLKDTITTNYLEKVWASGVHLINCREHYPFVFKEIKQLFLQGKIKEQELNRRVFTILLAKSWVIKNKNIEQELYQNKDAFYSTEKLGICYRIYKNNVVLIKDKKQILPLKNIDKKEIVFVSLGTKTTPDFIEKASLYSLKTKNIFYASTAVASKKYKQQKNQLTVFLLNYKISKPEDSLGLIALSKNDDAILINRYHSDNLCFAPHFNTVLHQIKPYEFSLVANVLFGSQNTEAVLPYTTANGMYFGQGIITKASRIGFCFPEEIGIHSDSLAKIDYIMQEGIRNKAFPGGQVLFAKDGKIFYHKSFGNHQYTLSPNTRWNDLYDLASITKVAATTLMGMHLYDLGKYKLNDSLYRFIPDTVKKHLKRESVLKNITFKELLIHQSGLPAGHNIIRFIRFTDSIGRLDKYFCDEMSDFFSVTIADSFYLGNYYTDTIKLDLHKISVDENKTYRYSDANMNVLQMFYARMINNKWHRYLDSVFYKPLGMKYTCFLPLKIFQKNQIAPTEQDKYWRKQLVHGYVHDPTAALYGGVAGNAGLFSCAYDMAVLCQMLLNNGYYGGQQFIQSSTIKLFTTKQEGTHRGLGFNTQVKGNTYGCSPYASEKTFGHTGFTGTAIWVDPEINLIYVFISNRVHPDAENKTIIKLGITKRIHSVVYEQLFPNINSTSALEI